MPDVQDAAPSAAPVVEAPSFVATPRSGPEYDTWRKTGALPEKSKPTIADPATADPSKETPSAPEGAEPAPEPESGKSQEIRRKPTAEGRIDQLTARNRQLERELEEARRPKATQAEPSPAKPAQVTQPQTYAEWRKTFKAQEFNEQYAKDHPDAQWEEMEDARTDYLADVRDQFKQYEERNRATIAETSRKIADAKAQYGEQFDEVLKPTLAAVTGGKVSPVIQQLMGESDVLEHLLFVLGSDQGEFQKFLDLPPGKQARRIAIMEHEIAETLAKGTTTARNGRGQFKPTEPTPPAKRGPESAPEPPIEIGSRGSGLVDESERALKNVERGSSKDFRAWKEAEDRKELARRRGA